MMKSMLRPALVLFVSLSVLTGLVYPAVVTVIGKALFSRQVAGSLIERDGKLVGSELIGQAFSDPKYFWSRPSVTRSAGIGAALAGNNGNGNGPVTPAAP